MRPTYLLAFFLAAATVLHAQTPAAQTPAAQPPSAQAPSADLGFTYKLPSDWEVMDTTPSLPVLKQQQTEQASSEDEKKGISCAQIALMARHPNPMSVVVVMALPYDCFGQTMTENELPGFASGAAEGLKKSLDLADPVFSAYKSGSHQMWIERAKGNPKGQPDTKYTVEVSCALLKKAAVCFMAMAGDEPALTAFENSAVTLDGDAPVALVPAGAFEKKQ